METTEALCDYILDQKEDVVEVLYNNLEEDIYDQVITTLEEWINPTEEGMDFIHSFAEEFKRVFKQNSISLLSQTVDNL